MALAKLESQAEKFIALFLTANEDQRCTLMPEGVDLANRLRRRAIDLAQSRATEFSRDVPLYHQLAAKVALLAHGLDSEALPHFERDIRTYRAFSSSGAFVEEYEGFRRACTAGHGSPGRRGSDEQHDA